MKRIDDEKLLSLLEQGIPQKEIAKRLGCVPSYVTKRKKQLMATTNDEPETFETLTESQRNFCIAKAQGKTNIEAVTEAYRVTSPESAKVMGSVLMKQDAIRKTIGELLDESGLTKDACVRQLKTLVYSKDGNVSLKALDQRWRLEGLYQAEPARVEVDIKVLQLDLTKACEALRKEQGLTSDEPLTIDFKPARVDLPVL